MIDITRPTYMEVSLDNFRHNIAEIKKIIGDKVEIMPVVKANAYGTYLNTRLDILKDFNIIAVATVDEAIEIRNIGYSKDIFVLNQPYKEEIDKIIKYDIVVGVSSQEFVYELSKIQDNIRVHVEVDTGMGRTGISPNNVEEFVMNLSKNIIVEGIYTHFSSADWDEEYTKKQINDFEIAIQKVQNICPKIKYIHAAASNGILYYPKSYYNLVRPGIIMYGYSPSEDPLEKYNFKPTTMLKSKIVFIKTVKEGTSIGYDRSFIASKEMKIATIPIGYADGFRRQLAQDNYVLISGKKSKILGKICMDSFMCDVTNIDNVAIGDDVIIWDNVNIKIDTLARKCDTINYEIISCISNRVPRLFI